ncbi:MAG TPA: DUF4097 family beta strand repeat-containing protein [Pyrinomonadaceae bacterium]|nr:DUF4097 family beta strand repeat-containing protein [Pyrinomonadaceae bacterium]
MIPFFLASFIFIRKASAQIPPPKPKPRPPELGEVDFSQRAIETSPHVNIKFCVSSGNLRVNGWDRPEVRIIVKNGREPAFKPLENDSNQKPIWLYVKGILPEQSSPGYTQQQCLAGENLQLDVPYNATLDISGRASNVEIDSVKKVKITIVEGVLALRNIQYGVIAETFQGDIISENIKGQVSLQTGTGNIVVNSSYYMDVADQFRAKTNSGNISLDNINHRQIDVNSITGSIAFNGKLGTGGIYGFRTTNGQIMLELDPAASFLINASLGFGTIDSQFPLKVITENVMPGGRSIVARYENGDANLNIITSSGNIFLKKRL